MINATRTLFTWSLRSDIKSTFPHAVRAAFAGFMLLAVLFAWADSLNGVAPGLSFLRTICNLNVLVITVAGISYFVSAVTEEKATGTLALLRLAGVTPLAIVLSNSTSRLISAMMLLLIQLPFVFLAVTLGGVMWQQVVAAYLALAAWMCLVANVALFCSVHCRTSGRAATLSTCILLIFFATGPILLGFSGLTGVKWIPPELRLACRELYQQQQQISVITRLGDIFASNTPTPLFTWQFYCSLLIGGTLFVISTLMFNRCSEPADDNPHGSSAKIRRFTVGRCWSHAMVWKDFLFFTGGRPYLLVKTLGYILLVIGFGWFHHLEHPKSQRLLSQDQTFNAFTTAMLLFSIEILLYSSNSLFQEVRQSAVGVLRLLPLSTPKILLEKVAACVIALGPAMVTVVVIFLYDPDAITRSSDFSGMLVTWLFLILLSSHFTVLLSLYTQWAALPIAVLLTAIAFPCIGGAAIGLTAVTQQAAQLNGIPWSVWLGVVINIAWMWLFVLLPIQIEVVNRWNRLSKD